jgi:hypothetical protein
MAPGLCCVCLSYADCKRCLCKGGWYCSRTCQKWHWRYAPAPHRDCCPLRDLYRILKINKIPQDVQLMIEGFLGRGRGRPMRLSLAANSAPNPQQRQQVVDMRLEREPRQHQPLQQQQHQQQHHIGYESISGEQQRNILCSGNTIGCTTRWMLIMTVGAFLIMVWILRLQSSVVPAPILQTCSGSPMISKTDAFSCSSSRLR